MVCAGLEILLDLRSRPSATKESVFGIDACNEDRSKGWADLAALASCKTLANQRRRALRPRAAALLDTALEGSVLDLWQQYLATARSISSQQYAAEQFP